MRNPGEFEPSTGIFVRWPLGVPYDFPQCELIYDPVAGTHDLRLSSSLLNEFGIIASINILAIFFLSLLIIPIIYSFMHKPKERHLEHLERGGFTVVPLAAAVDEVLADDAGREARRKLGRERAGLFTLDAHVDRLCGVFREALD